MDKLQTYQKKEKRGRIDGSSVVIHIIRLDQRLDVVLAPVVRRRRRRRGKRRGEEQGGGLELLIANLGSCGRGGFFGDAPGRLVVMSCKNSVVSRS